MKFIILLASVLAAAVAVPADTYSTKLEGINIQEISGNVVLLKNYGKCFMDAGPCTSEGNEIKKIMPEAIQTYCAKCTPKQKTMIREMIHAFQDKVPDIWEGISKKYNPNGEHTEQLNKFLSSSD